MQQLLPFISETSSRFISRNNKRHRFISRSFVVNCEKNKEEQKYLINYKHKEHKYLIGYSKTNYKFKTFKNFLERQKT